MKTRIHISLSVGDIERSVQYYSLLFGTQPTKVRDDYANFRLDEPGLHLAIVKSPKHAIGDSLARHYGVELFDDSELTEWRARLEKAGVPLKVEEQVTCCYAVGNKFWAKDPDGNDWEFWVRSAEADAMRDDKTNPFVDSKGDEAPCCTPDTAGQSGCC